MVLTAPITLTMSTIRPFMTIMVLSLASFTCGTQLIALRIMDICLLETISRYPSLSQSIIVRMGTMPIPTVDYCFHPCYTMKTTVGSVLRALS